MRPLTKKNDVKSMGQSKWKIMQNKNDRRWYNMYKIILK